MNENSKEKKEKIPCLHEARAYLTLNLNQDAYLFEHLNLFDPELPKEQYFDLNHKDLGQK